MYLRCGSWGIRIYIFGSIIYNMYGNWGGSQENVTGNIDE